MRPFLLMAWDLKRPMCILRVTDTWIHTFSSKEEAERTVINIPAGTYTGQDYDGYQMKGFIPQRVYTNYEIVDLRDWVYEYVDEYMMERFQPFLLTVGYKNHVECGTSNWVETFRTKEDAEKLVEKQPDGRYKISNIFNDYVVDWYDIINLQEWMN